MRKYRDLFLIKHYTNYIQLSIYNQCHSDIQDDEFRRELPGVCEDGSPKWRWEIL
jgi:hypothetical protein